MTVICAPAEVGLTLLDEASVQTCVTSPPYYGLRDYGHDGQIGLEASPAEYIDRLVSVFREVRRVLRDDGTLWLNIGDSYANDTKWGGRTSGKHAQPLHGDSGIGRRRTSTGYKSKELMGIPWQLAFALSADGWYLRQDIIWHKPNPMPESIRDRCTKAHEYLFLLSKSERYYFGHEAMKEPCVTSVEVQIAKRNKAPHKGQRDAGMRETTGGFDKITKTYETRNRRSVWTVATRPFKGAHFATFPPALIEPCVAAGSRPGDFVLDPFTGSGTTWEVARSLGRQFIGFELNPEYAEMAQQRNAQ